MRFVSFSLPHRRFVATVGAGATIVAVAITAPLALPIEADRAIGGSLPAIESAITVDPIEFGLAVPKLGIQVPIIPNVDGTNEAEYLKALEGGVAQLKGSPDPDQPGNLFIFGHSSYFKTKPGNYKEVFRHLDELQADDELTVTFKGQPYRYTVAESRVVADTDWSVAESNGDDTIVTLMTCWPPGTLDARYIVVARQVERSQEINRSGVRTFFRNLGG